MPRSAAVVLACLLPLLAVGSASAQIVNTLRGFGGEDPGWSGEALASFARSGGNTDVFTLSIGGRAQWQGERHRWRLLADATREKSGDETNAESALGHLRHNARIASGLHTLAFVQAQRNPFQRLESRVLFGGGLRADILARDDLAASVGLAHMVEVEDVEERAGSSTDQRLSAFLSVTGRMSDRAGVDVTIFAQPRWGDPADMRSTVAASLKVAVSGRLSLVVSADVVHDTEPPDRVEDTDWKTRTGFSWDL